MSDSLPSLFGDRARAATSTVPSTARWMTTAAAGDAPYVSWLAVDGFGALAGIEVQLEPGLNVILGENEAGKSTIFDFLTGVLFGFPRQKADERFRQPVNGGRHGGKVAICHEDGILIVERHGLPSKQLALTHEDGSPADDGDLVRLLGGSTRDLFRTVFALDLDDLRRLDGLADDDVREVLFSSSVLGQRRSAAKALTTLDDQREALARPRQGGRANSLFAKLSDAKRELAQAKTDVAGYREMRARAETLASQLDELRRELEGAHRRQRDVELLQRCLTTVLNRQRAVESLAEMAPIGPAERRALELTDRVNQLRAGLSGQMERLDRAGDLRRSRGPLAESVATRVDRLGHWATEAASDESLELAAARDDLDQLLARCTASRSAHEAADGVARHAASELAQLEAVTPGDGVGVPSEPDLQRQLADLRELRGLVSEHDILSRDLEHAAERERLTQLSRAPEATAALLLAALVAAAALVVIGAVSTVTGPTVPGLVSLAAGVAVAVAVAVLVSKRTSPTSRGRAKAPTPARSAEETEPLGPGAPDPRSLDRLQLLGNRIAERARSGGLAEPVVAASIERAVSELEVQLETRRRLDDLDERRRAAEAKLGRARAEVDAREREYRSALEAVRILMVRCGVPEEAMASWLRGGTGTRPGDPTKPAAMLRQLVELHERLKGLERLEAELADLEPETLRFDEHVRDVAAQLYVELPDSTRHDDAAGDGCCDVLSGAAAGLLVSEFEAIVARAREHERVRRQLEDTIATSASELGRLLGQGAEADALRRDLETGRVREWADRAEAAAEHVRRLEADHDGALREHERLLAGLSQLERSDEIACLEARIAGLETELDEVMREYLVTSTARLLVQRTLRRYEEERQPEVLARAAEHFARVTGGRYVRVVASTTGDGATPDVQVLQENGSRVDAHHLSRGTVEQLYLCLRLALAESFGERIVPLPLVLDDVLVNFDPARQQAMAAELAETARHHQLIFLTCHPHVAELLEAAGGSAGTATAMIKLARASA